ncbi:hypothetical protein LG293_17970 (plasmid) [Citricoccus nitrophenolicus]
MPAENTSPAEPTSFAEKVDTALLERLGEMKFWATHGPGGEWSALLDPGHRRQKPAWILEAGDVAIELPADYEHGAIISFAAQARTMFPQLLAMAKAVLSRHRLRGGDPDYPVCAGCTEAGRELTEWPCAEIAEVAPLIGVDLDGLAAE